LPADFATAYPKFWLDIKIVYFDQELGVDVEKSWAFYDLKFYEVAALQAVASMNTIPNHYKTTVCNLAASFTQFSAGGQEKQLIPTNLSAQASLSATGIKTIVEPASATLTASFTQTTVPNRIKGGVVALTSSASIVVQNRRIRNMNSALNSTASLTANLTNAPFEFIWNVSTGSHNIRLQGTNLVIDWGDGNVTSPFTASTTTTRGNNYASGGLYTVKVFGDLTFIRLASDDGVSELTSIIRFNKGLQSFSMEPIITGYFNTTFTSVPTFLPSSVTSLASAFRNCSAFNQDISMWNTSNVTNMNNMFQNASSFDQNISTWCVENIATKPTNFDLNTPVGWITAEKPNWGAPC
jgi:surface protein